MKEKILKIKVGEVWIDGRNVPVFLTAFQKTSKKGGTYYEARQQVFVQEIEKSDKYKKDNQSQIEA